MQVLFFGATVAAVAITSAAIIAGGDLPSASEVEAPAVQSLFMPPPDTLSPLPSPAVDPFEREKTQAVAFDLPAQF